MHFMIIWTFRPPAPFVVWTAVEATGWLWDRPAKSSTPWMFRQPQTKCSFKRSTIGVCESDTALSE